ncbi:winged helix DNA-binding protein [Murinocardiopsis flavida]|uniref:Winged helix DNA-binding protein n=1 Tax=Murinocardiopsis flavida TaxID=645275 RepID=A0A2P8DSX6_9ACTN|nr:winged helix DNA-binding domain-containing protein [Murinocardiopsis flavida]PSL00311.1 winged helix DNA-binding protein [Murinocardiopsis flavida]
MADKVSKRDVTAFRLGAHRLAEQLSGDGLVEAAGLCGIQNTPPGSALLALHARVDGLTQERMAEAVAEEKSLLQTWCMRGSPYFFPVADTPVFTTGVLPPTEEARRHFVLGVGPAVDRLGMSLTEAVERTGAEIADVLSGRRLAINELGAEIAARIAPTLPPSRRAIWDEEGPYAAGQPLGEGVVHFCLRILTLQGVVCFAARSGNKAPFVLIEEWLGHPPPEVAPAADTAAANSTVGQEVDQAVAPAVSPESAPAVSPESARAELLRRYLRCYGPSTRGAFAAWLGIRAGDTDPWWSLVEDELTPVEFDGTAWVLTSDLDALRSAPAPKGVRLLPPRDPYTQLRDRETIVDKKYHRDVWKSVGEPGTVLADGEVIGIWRPRKSGRKLLITITTFAPPRERVTMALRHEAEQITPLRGATSVDVRFDAY